MLDLPTFLVRSNFLENALFGRLSKIRGARRNLFAVRVGENPVFHRCGWISIITKQIDDWRLY